MKVFLSWSGKASHRVASAFRDWLPYMIHSIRPFISSGDISKGDRWSDVLADELKDAKYGIICVTPYNVYKPWLNFEAGALTRVIERSCVTPFLFQIDRPSLVGPLAQFQSTEFTKDDVFSLIYSINSRLDSGAQLEQGLLHRNFDHWWEELSKALMSIPVTSPGETRTFYDWLPTFEDLPINDMKNEWGDCSIVWFVTADVFRYALRDKSRLSANLKRVKYRYLIPEPNRTEELNAKKELDELARGSGGQLQYRCVPRELFAKRAATDYVMLESKACNHPASVFVKLPVPTSGNGGEYWFESDERAANDFYHRFVELWDPVNGVSPSAGVGPGGSLLASSTSQISSRSELPYRGIDGPQLVAPSSQSVK